MHFFLDIQSKICYNIYVRVGKTLRVSQKSHSEQKVNDMQVSPKKVFKGAKKLKPEQVVVITESMSGNIDVFSSDGRAEELMKKARKHIQGLTE